MEHNINNVERFIQAQNSKYSGYEQALKEVKNGRKETHWIWYIFPQMRGLGRSEMSYYYGISGKEEAKRYLQNDILRSRLLEITNEVNKNSSSPKEIFGYDLIKFKSCMKLFSSVSDNSIFKDALKRV